MKDELKAYFLIIAIGVGYLFPLSALTQPVDYWNELFPDINIEFPMTTLYMWVNLIVLGLVVFFRQESSVTFRIVGGFIGQLIVLIFIPNIPYFTSDKNLHFYLIMIATAIAASATSFIDSVAIGFAAQYPPKVLEGLQFGIGLSTLIGSVYRILTKAVFSSIGTIESSIIYFYVGALTILLCILSYYYLLSLPLSENIHSRKFESTAEENLKLVQEERNHPHYSTDSHHHYHSHDHHHHNDEVVTKDVESAPTKESERTKKVNQILKNASDEPHEHHHHTPGTLEHESFPRMKYATSDEARHSWLNRMRILRKVAYPQFLVFLVYFISLIVWPGMITEIPSYSFPYLEETKWWTLLLLLLYSVLDCIGRLCTPYRFGLTSQNIWIPVFGRILLIPIVYWIAAQQFFIHSDLLSIALIAFIGFTNGYIGSLCIIMVTEDVHPEEKEIAGAFTGFFLNVGLVFGSTAALFFQN
eukprot:gene5137-5503_t